MVAALTGSPRRGLCIGVIAEDQTDGKTLRVLLQKLCGSGTSVLIRADSGGGSIIRKGTRWMADLGREGCSAVIIVHDLDRDSQTGRLRDETALRARLEQLEPPRGISRYICIPVEELEAWFWADEKVLCQVARRPVNAKTRPEMLRQPKEALLRLSRDAGKKPRYATNDNPDLAEHLDLELCAQRCPSFHKLREFVATLHS